ncbi:hypothetical protein HDU98_004486, partial [Podochytrium sp. JEL0797]
EKVALCERQHGGLATTDSNSAMNAEVIALRERVAFLESQVSSLNSQLSTRSLQDASEMMAIDSLFSGPDDMTDLFAFLQRNPIEANALPSSAGIPNFEIQPSAGSAMPVTAQHIQASDPMLLPYLQLEARALPTLPPYALSRARH